MNHGIDDIDIDDIDDIDNIDNIDENQVTCWGAWIETPAEAKRTS